jgi:hypothetical protein
MADRKFVTSPVNPQPDVFDWASNWVGNVLVQMAAPSFSEYLNRQQDVAAYLRLGATVLWLRETRADGVALALRLAHRPAWMQMAADRELELSSDSSSLHMGLHDKYSKWPVTWRLPKGI